MPDSARNTKTIAKTILFCLIWATSFFLSDRLLFILLREGAVRYYASVKSAEFPWKTPSGQGDGDILVLGTSRAQHGFDDGALSSTLNVRIYKEAMAGHYPQYNYYFYQKYRQKFRKPTLVLYGLDYFLFEKDSNGLSLVRLDNNFAPERLNPRRELQPHSPWLSRASWLYRMKPAIDEFLSDVLQSGAIWEGENGRPAKAAPSLKHNRGTKRRADRGIPRGVAVHRPRTWPRRSYDAFPGREGLYLQRLLAALEQDAVPTFLVFIPEYIGTYETNFEQDKFKDDIRRLASLYPNVHVFDFDAIGKFDLENPGLFWNGGWGVSNSHLDDEGARLFSQELALAIKGILETKSPAGIE